MSIMELLDEILSQEELEIIYLNLPEVNPETLEE